MTTNMKRGKKLPWASGIFVLVLIIAAWFLFKGRCFTIELSESQIQKKLDERFPMNKQHLLVLTLTLSDPRVELTEGSDRISFGLSASVNIRINAQPKPLGGKGQISTALRYDPTDASFYLGDPAIQRLEVQGVPVEYVDVVNKLARELLSERLERYPVYTLDRPDLTQTAARLLLKELTVRNGNLVITLGF